MVVLFAARAGFGEKPTVKNSTAVLPAIFYQKKKAVVYTKTDQKTHAKYLDVNGLMK